MRVLIVEDSQTLAEALSQSLQSEGYACDTAADGVSALKFLASYRYDDDYLTKPFELAELLARLRALVRRPPQRAVPVLRHGDLEVDPRSRTARFKGIDLGLTPKEYGLLDLLLRRRGATLSRPQIFEHLYDSRSDASDKVVEVIVSTLRTKLAQCGLDELIVTRRGFGYILP